MPEAVGGRPPEAKRNAREIETWLISWMSEQLEVEPASIDVRQPFTSFGLGSADAVGLAGDLENWLGGSRLPATLAWDFPTIEALSQHLADPGSSGANRVPDDLEALLSEIEGLSEDEAVRLRGRTG